MKSPQYHVRDVLVTLAAVSLLASCAMKTKEEPSTSTSTDTSSSTAKGADKAAENKGETPSKPAEPGAGDKGAADKTSSAGTAGSTQSKGASDATSSSTATSTASSDTGKNDAATNSTGTDSSSTLIADKNAATSAATTAATPASSTAAAATDRKLNVNLSALAAEVPICSVGGVKITVGDYRRMLRIQQLQTNQKISTDPAAKAKLLEQAKSANITLTPEEKANLIKAAHNGQDPKVFKEALEKAHATEQQFDDEVLASGLAFKTSNAIVEQSVLPDLVNRELLAQAAKEGGGEKEAMNKYLAFKKSKNYDALVAETKLPPDQLKTEMVQANLATIQLGKLEGQAKLTDAEIKKLYEANKAQLKHGERVKLSTILIACPEHDVGPIASIRNQLKKANPKATEKELDDAAARLSDQQKQKALICFEQAKKPGTDFAKLANENTNDPSSLAKKNGGDLGFLDKKDMPAELADPVFKLKAGEVLPKIVSSELGFNIYKVTAKQGEGTYKYDEVKSKLEMLGRQQKFQQILAQWIEHRRQQVKVEFTPKFLSLANQSAKTTSVK